MKIPKQVFHWAGKAGLKLTSKYKRKKFYSWKGKGRNWRINIHNRFQVSEPYDKFDRWANSVEETWGIPQSECEFITLVESVGKNG